MAVLIETNRLIIREFTISNFMDVYALGSNKEVQKYTGDEAIQSPEEAKEIIQGVYQQDYLNHGYGRWAVIFKPDGRLIGFSGLKYLPEYEETDIGFRFLPEYWGMGIATESARAVLEYGFDALGLKRIIAIAMAENIASNKVLTKIGLHWYKTDEYCGDQGSHHWYKIEYPTATH